MTYADATRRLLALGCAWLAAALSASCSWTGGDHATWRAEIRRNEAGIPHIVAQDWGSLGYGYGYAQASDDLCTMAQAFVTYRGERARYFGANGALQGRSTLGQPSNLDSDFFFRLVDTDDVVARYRAAQPPALRELVHGFAAGYNRYAGEIRAGHDPAAHLACRAAPWLTPITEADVYRRLYAANLAGGFARFVTEIAEAHPPAANAAPTQPSAQPSTAVAPHASAAAWADKLALGGTVGIGSNAMAFGADGSASGQPVLLGNPHWFWSGPDRFYEARLTLPGKLDVSGASFLGVPVVMIGFNRDVAWTHTVSSARRFGFFELSLVPGNPTAYRYDGRVEPMTAVPLSVEAREADGTLKTVQRTLYRTRFGPVVDLGAMSPALAWSHAKAFAIADINASNFRVFENFFAWGQAHSLDQFVDIQKRFAAMPWVNTIAIGRNDPRVWYADLGAVPNVPDALVNACTTPAGRAFDARLPGVPFLDGSRAACAWIDSPGAAQTGAFPADEMPVLWRRDFVANMNNSYWLANPDAPAARHASIFGAWATGLSLRAQLGFLLARAGIAGYDDRSGRLATPETVQRLALGSQVLSAMRFKQPLLDAVCAQTSVTLAAAQGDAAAKPRTVGTREACRVLRAWHDTGGTSDRGAVLWDEIWARVDKIGVGERYVVPFHADDPLDTPRGLNTRDPALAQAFGAAVAAMNDAGRPLDLARGDVLGVEADGARIPLYGGCEAPGYFTSACADGEVPGKPVSRAAMFGNTYMQVVTFGPDGVRAATMLAPSQSDDPASPGYADGTRRYARQQWTDIELNDDAHHAAEPPPTVLEGSDAAMRTLP